MRQSCTAGMRYDRLRDRKGGKLILVHGRSDELSPEQDTIRLYHGQVNRYGEQAVKGAVAFYLVPGYGHGHGAGFNATGGMPLLAALEGWVENGVAPATAFLNHHRGHQRTRRS